MHKKPHLVFVVTEDWYFLSHRAPLARAALDAGYRVSVITNVGRAAERLGGLGMQVVPFDFVRASTNPFKEAYTLCRLIKLYAKLEPDIVHHVAMKPVLYGSIAAHVSGVKAQVHALPGLGYVFSEPSAWLLRGIIKIIMRLVLRSERSVVIVQNPDDQAFFVRGRIVPPERVRLIPGSGVDLEQYRPAAEPSGTPLIILPARMLKQKGVLEFVAAAQILKAKGLRCRFALVGAPDAANPQSVHERQLRAWHEEGAVEYWGWRQDMRSVLGEAHIVCLPSSYGEGVPKSLIEAAAAGKPIVTTDIAGCRDIVAHGDNGLLVPVASPEALSQAIERLVASADERQRMGARSRERAMAFDVRDVVRRTLREYEILLDRSR